MAPRIAESDYLDPIAVEGGMHEGDWVRVPQYKNGHRVGKDGTMARCGLPLSVEHSWWERFRSVMDAEFNADPGEYYIALDTRKTAKCGACSKGKDVTDIPDRGPAPESSPVVETLVAEASTPAQRLAERRNHAAVVRVARQLGAEVIA